MTHQCSVRPEFLEFCQKQAIKVIYECGSRDSLDGLHLLNNLKAEELHVFECNPQAVQLCQQAIQKDASGSKVTLNDFAVMDYDGSVEFMSVDPAKSLTIHDDGNIGASSVFALNPKYPHEKLSQKKIQVPCRTLDSYASDHRGPDLLWMDLQGAELKALQGSREFLKHVKVIHLEVAFRRVYTAQPLFADIHKFLSRDFKLIYLFGADTPLKQLAFRLSAYFNIFELLSKGPWFTDAVYLSKQLLRD